MEREIEIEGIKCLCINNTGSRKVAYMIYPAIVPLKERWLTDMAIKYNITIVMIYIPADGWNDMLTPWPEPGETKDSPSFAGFADKTLKIIREQIIPQTDKFMGNPEIDERDLIGVSLSGLFTLWEWFQCETFRSIACLSGSFWYPGFIEWFEKQTIPPKRGKAYFLLGVKEPNAWIKAYRCVGINTEKIVERLKVSGISTKFDWVPGNHIANPLQRAEDALKALFL